MNRVYNEVIAWEEVVSDDGGEDHSTHNHHSNSDDEDKNSETATLITRDEERPQKWLPGGGTKAQLALFPKLGPRGEMAYLFLTFFMILLHLAAGVAAASVRYMGKESGEICQKKLPNYLLFTIIHSFLSAILLFVYLLIIWIRRCRHLPNFSFLESNDDRPGIIMLETLLLALAAFQIGLGILAEVWVGRLGGFYTHVTLPNACVNTAPMMFRTTAILGLYQFWIVIFLFISAIRIACCLPNQNQRGR